MSATPARKGTHNLPPLTFDQLCAHVRQLEYKAHEVELAAVADERTDAHKARVRLAVHLTIIIAGIFVGLVIIRCNPLVVTTVSSTPQAIQEVVDFIERL
jgi:predicted RNase H-like nuclease (RuvC/YqgF family)